MNIIDTHVHLQDFTSENVKDVIISSHGVGIEKFICVSAKSEDWSKIEKLIHKYPKKILPAFGIHPWYAKDGKKNWSGELENMLKKYPEALVGETGLDGYKDPDGQIEVFERQLFLAHKYNRPIIIHCVKSQNWFENNWRLLPEKFVFHSYNGKKEFLKEITAHNGYVSFSFSVLQNKELAELVNLVPIHKILLETDSPYQSFEKNRDNEPALLPFLVKEIAKIRGMPLNEFSRQIYNNSLEFIKVG
ncbi:MAG: TatD family hydrolase [Lactobacillaceae bacterium]|nr:TatD family hydrolase [Lactobacillaceae bacterium]